MQEVLSRTKDCEDLSPESEFYELRLDDLELRSGESDYAAKPAFCVKEVRARWDQVSEAIVWDTPDLWVFETIQEAKVCYQERRLGLAQRGFIYSDMDW
jgi:hypothetical protein